MKNLIKRLTNRKVFLIIFAFILILIASLFLKTKFTNVPPDSKTVTQTEIEDTDKNKIYADLDGDGQKEYLVLNIPSDDSNIKSIIAYDSLGKEIGRLPDGMATPQLMEGSIKVHRLKLDDSREFVSMEFIAGPHQSETMFYGLFQKKIEKQDSNLEKKNIVFPICHNENISKPDNCLFYSGEVGELQVQDLDGDVYSEIVEYVDEYPSNGELAPNEKEAIAKTFKEQGIEEFTEGMERIALREKGGRGRKVVWGIYRFDGKYLFIQQLSKDYDRYYEIVAKGQSNFMKKSQLSKESLDYIEFARKFWTRR